jgi:HlyD family secretion protein
LKRKNFLLVGLVSLVILLVGGCSYLSAFGSGMGINQTQATKTPAIQQAEARRGDLRVTVSGTGTLQPVTSLDLSFQGNGELLAMNVKTGDVVKAGDVLARLKLDKTPAQYASELADARQVVLKAQQTLDELYADAQLTSAQALSALESAQQTLDDLQHPELQQAQARQAVAEAKNAVQDAQLQVEILNSKPSQAAIDTAYASLLFKQKDLADLQDQIAKLDYQVRSADNSAQRSRLKRQMLDLQVKLAQQQQEVEAANNKYNTMNDPADALDLQVAGAQLATAQAQLAQAQAQLEVAQSAPLNGDLAVAQNDLAEAQTTWERLKDGPDPDQVAQAQAQLAKAQAQLALVQRENLELELAAPWDGTVLSVNANPGDRINGQVILTLADLSRSRLEIYLDETDQANIKAGFQAEVVFDALPDQNFSGQVVSVDPSLQRSGNTYAVRAWVDLDTATAGTVGKLPMGLNASVDIVVGEARNTVLVPVEALHELNPGNYVVYVVHEEELEQRPVTVGLRDYTSAEIMDGLAAGETVAIGNVNPSGRTQ